MASLLTKFESLVSDYKWSPLFLKWSFLAAVSAVLERRCYIDEEALGLLYPNLYVLLVGPPGCGKSSSADFVIDTFLRTLENGPLMTSNQQSPASLIDELEAASKQRYEHKTSPLFAFAGEFNVWFKDIGGGEIVDLLLNFWDTRRPGVEWQKNTKKAGIQKLPNPALTLLGCITPSALIENRLVETASIGFISRTIIVCEPRHNFGTTDFVKINHAKIVEIQREFARMNKIEGTFVLGPGAEEARRAILARARKQLHEYSGDLMQTYMSRKAVQIRKVSLLLSAMRNSRKIVLPEDLEEAETLINELEPTILDAFGMQTNYQDPALATKVLSHFRPGDSMSEDELFARFLRSGTALSDNSEYRSLMTGLYRARKLIREERDGKTILKRPT